MSIGFTERELDIMAVLWERGPSTVAEIRARMPGEPAHTTVHTLVKILEDKGHVAHTEEGRAHRFFPLVERDAAGRGALRRVVQAIFGGSASALVNNLVADRGLTRAELEELRETLDQRLAGMTADEQAKSGRRGRASAAPGRGRKKAP